tara:strand:+ start:260 stop:799 length:540 start_codon:yes stop_codon:yes gene_type:complete
MLEETQVQQNSEVSQSDTTTGSDDHVDYKSLYLDEVQNAKKLRKRAQESEMAVKDLHTAQETQKVKQLKEQEKYKELYEDATKKLEDAMPYKEKYIQAETSRREELLSQLPKKDRESLNAESTKALEYIVNNLNQTKPSNPQSIPGAARDTAPDKPWSEMNDAERRAYYAKKASEQVRG